MNYPKEFYNQYLTKDYYQTEPWEAAEERFRKRFELHVETSKRNYRYRPVPISYRDWDHTVPINHEVDREPLLKVYISREHYEHLVVREQHYEQAERENHRLRRMEQRTLDEMALRGRNPTLKKAWDKYVMLLDLVKDDKHCR